MNQIEKIDQDNELKHFQPNESIEETNSNKKNKKFAENIIEKETNKYIINLDQHLIVPEICLNIDEENISELFKMRVLSEFYIIDSFVPKLLDKINNLLRIVRKSFIDDSNFKKLNVIKSELEKQINRFLSYEEKNNIIKIKNNNFTSKILKKQNDSLKNKEFFNLVDYALILSELESAKKELDDDDKSIHMHNIIKFPSLEELRLRALDLLNENYFNSEKKEFIVDDDAKANYSLDRRLDSKSEETNSNLLNEKFSNDLNNTKYLDAKKNNFPERIDNNQLNKEVLNQGLERTIIDNEEMRNRLNLKNIECEFDENSNLFSLSNNLVNSSPIQTIYNSKIIRPKVSEKEENISKNNKEEQKKDDSLSFKIIRNKEDGFIKYIGETLHNQYHGRGIYFHSNGTIKYKGYFKNSKYHGLGFYLTSDANTLFFGQFKNDFSCGTGIELINNCENSSLNSSSSPKSNSQNTDNENLSLSEASNSDQADSNLSLIDKDQKRKFKSEFSVRIISNFFKDVQVGYGINFNEDNSICEGKFLNGILFDFGTYYNQKGFIEYQGFFYNDKFNGLGIYYIEKDQKFYFGELKNNEYEGVGVFMNNNFQLIHIGEYKNGEGYGFGKWFNSENHQLEYEGFFKGGYYHGIGVLYDSLNGFVRHMGKFKAGKIIQKVAAGKHHSRDEIEEIILKKYNVSLDNNCKMLDERIELFLRYLNWLKKNKFYLFK